MERRLIPEPPETDEPVPGTLPPPPPQPQRADSMRAMQKTQIATKARLEKHQEVTLQLIQKYLMKLENFFLKHQKQNFVVTSQADFLSM